MIVPEISATLKSGIWYLEFGIWNLEFKLLNANHPCFLLGSTFSRVQVIFPVNASLLTGHSISWQ